MLKKLTIDKLGKKLADKRVLMRVDFNVPIKNGKINDETKIKESLDTIRYALDNGAKSVVLLSHLGRPNGQKTEKDTLAPVAPRLADLLKREVEFVNESVGAQVLEKVNRGSNGHIFLLENLRFHPEEEGSKTVDGVKTKETKENIQKFRNQLTNLGDIYINDAFGTAHRAHSSVAGIDLNTRAAGLLMKKELNNFANIIENPARPYVVIVGGAKVKDKIPLIKNLLDKVDKLIITGGMAFTFLKVGENIEIGKSLFDKDSTEAVKEIIKLAKEKKVELILPEDFVVADEIKDGAATKVVDKSSGIPSDKLGIDVGPKTIEKFHNTIVNAKTIFLNGSNGVFESQIGKAGSIKLIESLVAATKNGAHTVCGGGDTVTLVNSVPGANKIITHLSTGGGASLELLEGKSLPGINYLSDIDTIKH